MNHTYSRDYCADCDAAYRSYACVASDANSPKPNQEQDKTLDEILLLVADEAADLAACNYYTHEEISKSFPQAKAAIQAKLAAARDEVIGQNHPHTPNAEAHFDAAGYKHPCCERVQANNNLRAEQRTRWDKFVEEL